MLITYIRTLVIYLLLLAVVRLMGKRELGQMEPSEFVVSMLVADLAAVPMQNNAIPLQAGLVPIVTVLGAELVLSTLALHSIRLRRLLCGKPVILIENGKPLAENLRRTRITLDELTGQLREKDVLDLRTVQYAILETNGNLSVFPYPETRPAAAADAGIQPRAQHLPITVVSDGRLLRENLQKSGKTEAWLQKTLKKEKATVKSTWLLTVDRAGQVIFYPKEGRG